MRFRRLETFEQIALKEANSNKKKENGVYFEHLRFLGHRYYSEDERLQKCKHEKKKILQDITFEEFFIVKRQSKIFVTRIPCEEHTSKNFIFDISRHRGTRDTFLPQSAEALVAPHLVYDNKNILLYENCWVFSQSSPHFTARKIPQANNYPDKKFLRLSRDIMSQIRSNTRIK